MDVAGRGESVDENVGRDVVEEHECDKLIGIRLETAIGSSDDDERAALDEEDEEIVGVHNGFERTSCVGGSGVFNVDTGPLQLLDRALLGTLFKRITRTTTPSFSMDEGEAGFLNEGDTTGDSEEGSPENRGAINEFTDGAKGNADAG